MTTVGVAAAINEGVTEHVAAAYILITVKHSHSFNDHETVATAAIGSILLKHIVHTALGYFATSFLLLAIIPFLIDGQILTLVASRAQLSTAHACASRK